MLLVTVYFSRVLPEGSYGAYQYFWVQFYIFSAVACLGIHAVVLTYSPPVLDRLLRAMPPLLLRALPLWMLAVSAVFAVLQHRAGFSFVTPFAFLLILSCSAIAESVLVAFRRFGVLVPANLLYAGFFCGAHWLKVRYGYDMPALFFIIALLAALRLLWYVAVIIRFRRQLPGGDADLTVPAPADIRSLWIHMGVYDLVQILFRWVDKLVIALVVSAELFAVYYNGTIEIPFLPLILSAAGSAGLLQLAAAHAADDRAGQSHQLLLRSGRILSCIVFPLFFFLLFFRYELFGVLLSSKYLPSVPVFLVSLFAVPVRAYSFTTVLQHYHKGRIINTGAVLDLVLACALMYPLYRLSGLPGVALSFVITTYLQAAFYLYHTARILQLPVLRLLPLRNWLWKVALSCVLFLAAHNLLAGMLQPPVLLIAGIMLLAACTVMILGAEIRNERKRIL